MKRTLALLAILLTVTGSTEASPAKLNDSQLKAIQFDQKLGQQVSLDLPFVDERGRPVRLSDCLDGKPAIVELGYFGCPMLCTLVLNGLISTLQDITPSPGHQFSVIFVSINPSETPALAAAKKATYLKQYGRHGTAAGWHFLTGSQGAIAALADQVGYRYAYDPASKQYAHPSGLVLLTPDGKVSRYFFGISFEAKDMDQALKVAASEKIGSEVRQFIYLCFHYSPIRGKYGVLIMEVVRGAGIITMVGLACLLYVARRPGETKEKPAA